MPSDDGAVPVPLPLLSLLELGVPRASTTAVPPGPTGTEYGQENWEAYSVPVGPGGTAVVEARAIPNSNNDNNGNGTGTAPSSDGTPSNPTAADSIAAQVKPTSQPCVICRVAILKKIAQPPITMIVRRTAQDANG